MTFQLETDVSAVAGFLTERSWIEADEAVERVSIAGEGNMNRTVRVVTDRRSVVLKQSRPYCVKFPEIAAPIERLAVEVAFYRVATRTPEVAARMPRVLAFDGNDFVAMIEDLGPARDLLGLYGEERLTPADLRSLCEFARALHAIALTEEEREALSNDAMRALNHEHIFEFPLDPGNGLDLDSITPGLSELASVLQEDDTYVAEVLGLGMVYTSADGPCLLHGDYYPGSFLRTAEGLRVIDPEFAFSGPAEFDLGVLAAHLVLGGAEIDVLDRVGAAYARPLQRRLLEGFAGAELMRRLLGVSQLPLHVGLGQKREWLTLSRQWVTGER